MKLSEQQLLEIGFEKGLELLFIDLGKTRRIIISSLGTNAESMYIAQLKESELKDSKVTDIVCVHSHDYDGLLTIQKVKNLMTLIS